MNATHSQAVSTASQAGISSPSPSATRQGAAGVLGAVAQRVAARFVPAGAVVQQVAGTDAVVYLYKRADGQACALGYVGTAGKPAFHHRFGGEAFRDRFVGEWVAKQQRAAAVRAERLLARKSATHTLKLGDIVYACWGYEQTNVDFFQVVRVVSDRSVVIRAIKGEIQADGPMAMTGHSTPCRDQFEDGAPELLRRAEGCGVMNVCFKHPASLWTGKPVRCTWYA